MVFDRLLYRGCRDHSDVEDIAPNRLKRGVDDGLNLWSRYATVTADHDAGFAASAGHRPRAEAGRKFCDDLRCQGLSDAPSNTGHADHQTFVRHSGYPSSPPVNAASLPIIYSRLNAHDARSPRSIG